MSFNRAKKKQLLNLSEDEDDEIVTVQKPVFKRSEKIQKSKRKKLNIEFDEPEDDQVVDFKLTKFKKKASKPAPVRHEDVMDVDEKYNDEVLQELKAQSRPAASQPKPYQVLDIPEPERSEVPDQYTVEELKNRETREMYDDLKEGLDNFISVEDYDQQFDFLDKMNRGGKDIDKHVDFEVDLDENLNDERLPLTERELEIQKRQKRFNIEAALEVFNSDEEDVPVQLGSISQFIEELDTKITDLKDVQELNDTKLQQITTKLADVQQQKTKLLQDLQSLANDYT